ncbi:MAG TPA: thioredoxin domain-containing protein [Verrucomicrobiae bacterium]|nr:thioredoxin domain-containing protein [Verrucomicrobiae bacterium]
MKTISTTAERPQANRLAREKSPYLLQHQFNPVDWRAWGEEAFAAARREDKPIFLSIGYSTCHWCHVMERESFENERVARFLNRHFINIKLDREERPDVDKIYMTFVQATTGQGGWPLNVFLTPDLKPFFGGTYFPPDAIHGRAGFLQLLEHIRQLWESRRGDVANSAQDIHSKLEQATAAEGQACDAGLLPEAVRSAGARLKQNYDPVHGGFGDAPKFPQPSHPQFLLRYGAGFHDPEAIDMVLRTCEHMAAGGIHDQLGGGFARYSVDRAWLVPHFEKMLYDNAQLAQLYLEAWLVSGNPLHAFVARDILDYVLRDMTHPEGGFYSAEDADSEGHEGKFYCWTTAELSSLLSREEFKVAARYFGMSEKGNFVDHSHPQPLSNQNVLSIVDPNVSDLERPPLESARRKMFAARGHRVRPHLDDKILASWNGLMLGAMARAYAVLGEEVYRAAAEKNLGFLQKRLWDPETRTLHHRWREGEHDQAQLLEGYAFLLSGVLDLYEATLLPRHLEFAIALAQSMMANFFDSGSGGFWQSPLQSTDLILRLKEYYDGAEPSGNSAAMMGLLRLGRLTGNESFIQAAEKTLHLFAGRLRQIPQAMAFMLQALDFWLVEPVRAVIAGDPEHPETKRLIHAAHSVYHPHKIILGSAGPVEPFARTLPTTEGPVAYLCTGTACQPPTNDSQKLSQMLKEIE